MTIHILLQAVHGVSSFGLTTSCVHFLLVVSWCSSQHPVPYLVHVSIVWCLCVTWGGDIRDWQSSSRLWLFIFIFHAVYSTILSVLMLHSTEQLNDNELQRMWKETFMAWFVCLRAQDRAEALSHVHVAEVEKQLQGSATPQLAYKKPHAGSTGNIHGLVMVSDQVPVAGMVAGQYSILCQRCTACNLTHCSVGSIPKNMVTRSQIHRFDIKM